MIFSLKLPLERGIKLLKNIQIDNVLKEIPIIVLLSSDYEIALLKSHKLSVHAYMRKPWNYNDYLNLVKRIEDFCLQYLLF